MYLSHWFLSHPGIWPERTENRPQRGKITVEQRTHPQYGLHTYLTLPRNTSISLIPYAGGTSITSVHSTVNYRNDNWQQQLVFSYFKQREAADSFGRIPLQNQQGNEKQEILDLPECVSVGV